MHTPYFVSQELGNSAMDFNEKLATVVDGSLYFSVVFAVLEHSVLECEYAPLFQDDFVLLLLRDGGGRSLFVLRV